jgi:hypothetical protein
MDINFYKRLARDGVKGAKRIVKALDGSPDQPRDPDGKWGSGGSGGGGGGKGSGSSQRNAEGHLVFSPVTGASKEELKDLQKTGKQHEVAGRATKAIEYYREAARRSDSESSRDFAKQSEGHERAGNLAKALTYAKQAAHAAVEGKK